MTERETAEMRFKECLERNFEQSALAYDLFEEKHHLFDSLTHRQLELIAPSRPKRILDVGCGTGVSSLAIHNSLSTDGPPSIFAIDISDAMLSKAKERCRDIPGVYFVRGEAENLESFFHEGFDGIFFSASIFLYPKFRDTIRQACGLLVPDGVLSISHYSGLFTEEGDDAILKAFPDFRHHFGAASFHDLANCFDGMRDFRTTWVDYRFEANREFLFDFLSIPAQSAGLFPKTPYLERIPMIREMCSVLEGKAGPVFMGWKFCIARKALRVAC
jgi:ubiquinone/menaquinone biosynthesis C-methylase UbiE